MLEQHIAERRELLVLKGIVYMLHIVLCSRLVILQLQIVKLFI